MKIDRKSFIFIYMYPNLGILVEMRMNKKTKEFVRNEKENYTISLTVT